VVRNYADYHMKGQIDRVEMLCMLSGGSDGNLSAKSEMSGNGLLEYRMPDLGFQGGYNSMPSRALCRHGVCYRYHCACIYLHSRSISSEDSGSLGCCAMSIFRLPPTFRRGIYPLILWSSSRARTLFSPEDKGTAVV
jgi:hypothetical protein